MQELQYDLRDAEDDISQFIRSQKRRLNDEKVQLERNSIESSRAPEAQKRKSENSGEGGLKLGGYEMVQEKLRRERQDELKQYLAQQNVMRNRPQRAPSGGQGRKSNKVLKDRGYQENRVDQTSNNNNNNNINPRVADGQYKDDIDREYEKLLARKKNHESAYRSRHDVLADENVQHQMNNRKVIEFDDDEEELFKYVLRQKENRKQLDRATSATSRKEKTTTTITDTDNDGRSSSVPPPNVPNIFFGEGSRETKMRNKQKTVDVEHKKALERQMIEKQQKGSASSHVGLSAPSKLPKVFGGSSHSMMRKQQNIEHKEYLEQQIRQKEELKLKEKMKKQGRRIQTSLNDQAQQYPSVGNVHEVITDDVTKLAKLNILDDSQHNIASSQKQQLQPQQQQHQQQQQQPMNMSAQTPVGYPVPPNYGMYNPQMMMYPQPVMMNPPVMNYNPAMMPYSYGQNNAMSSVPQGGNTMPQQVGQVATTSLQKENSLTRKSDMNSSGGYVPSAMAEKTTNGFKPSIKIHASPGGVSNNEPDKSDKRLQQMQYQRELKEQMELKKIAAEKEKLEKERYEMKLEKEIEQYDPWGKSGCGAPVRNSDGKIVADLKNYLNKSNEGVEPSKADTGGNENKLPDDLSPILKALQLAQGQANNNDSSDKTEPVVPSIAVDNTSPSHKRGNFVRELQGLVKSPRETEEQSSYKAFLQQQVEERKRKEEELKEKERIEEEKENRRLAAQQQRMRDEYEADKEKARRKAEEARLENEALQKAAEEKRLEMEKKQQQLDEEREAKRRREMEEDAARKRAAEQNKETEPSTSQRQVVRSPPIETARTRRTPPVNQEPTTETNETIQYLNSIRNNLQQAKQTDMMETSKDNEPDKQLEMSQQKDLIRQLSALRKQLIQQEQKVQTDLERNKKEYIALADNSNVKSAGKKNAFERAIITSGKQRDGSGKIPAPAIPHDNYHHEQMDLDKQQREYMQRQEQRLAALRKGVENNTLPPEFRIAREASKQSLLESDSKFFSLDNNIETMVAVPDTVKEPENSVQGTSNVNPGNPGNPGKRKEWNVSGKQRATSTMPSISASLSTLQVQDMAHKNAKRLENLAAEDDDEHLGIDFTGPGYGSEERAEVGEYRC